MDIGSLGGVASVYNYSNQIRNKQVSSSSFVNTLKETYSLDNAVSTELSFEDTLKAKYPGAKYHVMDASKISQGTWERNDFPFEKFFEDDIDESVLNWTPTGKDPDMADSCVQARLDSTLGGKAIVVPPELEEKMKNNPELAQKVMDKVDSFIANHPTRPGRVLSYLIALDENGDIAHFRVTGGGGHISGPSEEELRQFEEEQKTKREKKAKQERENIERSQEATEEHRRTEMENLRRRSIEAVLHEQMLGTWTLAIGDTTESVLAAYGAGTSIPNSFDI